MSKKSRNFLSRPNHALLSRAPTPSTSCRSMQAFARRIAIHFLPDRRPVSNPASPTEPCHPHDLPHPPEAETSVASACPRVAAFTMGIRVTSLPLVPGNLPGTLAPQPPPPRQRNPSQLSGNAFPRQGPTPLAPAPPSFHHLYLFGYSPRRAIAGGRASRPLGVSVGPILEILHPIVHLRVQPMADCGATGFSFVDLEFARLHGLNLQPLTVPRKLESGKITHIALHRLEINGHQECPCSSPSSAATPLSLEYYGCTCMTPSSASQQTR